MKTVIPFRFWLGYSEETQLSKTVFPEKQNDRFWEQKKSFKKRSWSVFMMTRKPFNKDKLVTVSEFYFN